MQGGAERQVLELVRRLPRDRYAPSLLLYEDRVHYHELLRDDVPRHVLGVPRMTLGAFVALVRLLRRERPAILHTYLNRANLWGRLAGIAAGVPAIVASYRARMIEPQYVAAERALARRAARLVTNSRGIADELATLAGVDEQQLAVIHNFIDLETFRPPSEAERTEARARWHIAPDERALLYPARICLQKNQLAPLLALDALRRAGELPPGARLLLAGRLSGGTIAPLVEKLAQRPGLAPYVRLLGSQTDIRSLYHAADALILPSLWEGLPNAALEGCACGLPALLSHAANLDGIIDATCGIEVPTADRPALQRAMARLFALPSATLREMGRRARSRVVERFDADSALQQTLRCYDAALARSRSYGNT